MATESDRIRAEIDATRGELADDVSTLAVRTNPKKIAGRRWHSMKATATSVRHRLMGASSESTDTLSDKASGIGGAVRGAPETMVRQAQGSPLAAGVIAFGAGLLTAALLPRTEPEQRIGGQIAERAHDVVDSVQQEAKGLGSEIKDSAVAAGHEVGQTTREAAARTAEQARQSGHEAREQIQQ